MVILSGGYNVNLEILNQGNTTTWGTLSCGAITTSGSVNANGNKLNFTKDLDQLKINWGTNSYGFEIAASTLQYKVKIRINLNTN